MRLRRIPTQLATAFLFAPFLSGCSSLFDKKPDAPTTVVKVEREDAAPDMTPAQRGQAYRNAYDEGLRLVKDGQFGLAIGAFEAALELRQESTEALFNLGACHESIGDPLRAIHYYRRVLDANPEDADCFRNLGTSFIKLYYREKSPAWRTMAFDAWRRSLKLNPDQPDVRRYLTHVPELD